MPSFNEQLADRFTRHAVDLERFKAHVRSEALKHLRKLERDLEAYLKRIALDEVKATTYRQARLNALLKQTRESIKSTYSSAKKDVDKHLRSLAQAEDEFVRASVNRLAGIELVSVAVSAEQLKAIVSDLVIEGAPSAEWWARQSATLERRFSDVVRQGMLQGNTTQEIVSVVRSKLMQDEATRNITSLVHTSCQAVSQAARVAVYDLNTDVIRELQQRSTLDTRTTPICQAYSGKRFDAKTKKPIGHKLPFVNAGGSVSGCPRHWRCRSTFMPVIKGFSEMRDLNTGGRPSKDADAYFRKRLEELGVPKDRIEKIVMNQQAALDGRVPQDWTYEDWLKKQSAARQQEILGATKYKLWKSGRLKSLTQLLDYDGSPLTIEELLKKIRA